MGVKEKAISYSQVAIFKQLYNYRFGTVDLLARDYGLSGAHSIYTKLAVLVKHGYLGRKYQCSYRLEGRAAEYFLLPKAFSYLRLLDNISGNTLKNIYKDVHASRRFIDYCLDIYRVDLALKSYYRHKLWIFTGSNLNFIEFKHFPRPLPDSFISLRVSSDPQIPRQYYFLDIYSSHVPLFVHSKKLKNYCQYLAGGQWEQVTHTQLSGILMVAETPALARRLLETTADILESAAINDDQLFYITTKDQLLNLSSEDPAIWQQVIKPTISRSLPNM
jgi:hypothetical protein